MDYQEPMNQPNPLMDQPSPNRTMYIALASVAAVIIAAGALWSFFFSGASSTSGISNSSPSAVNQAQPAPLTSGNTTADIQTDLNQTPDSSAALNQDASASNQEVQKLQ